MWVDRSAKYPYVSANTWWTRYWLLARRLGDDIPPSVHDRRVASILITAAQRLGLPSSPRGAAATKYLYEVRNYGQANADKALPAP